MKNPVATLGCLLSLALGACGSALDPYVYVPAVPVCYVCIASTSLGPTVTLFEEEFDAEIRPDRWLVEGSTSIDAIDGSPAPSLVTGRGASGVATVDAFPVGNGLQVTVAARLGGSNAGGEAAGIRLRDVVTGEVIASVEALFRPSGGATLVYRFEPTGAAESAWTEELAAADVASSYRTYTFVLTPEGRTQWIVDGEIKLRLDGSMHAAAVNLSLSTDSAGTHFDSVSVVTRP